MALRLGLCEDDECEGHRIHHSGKTRAMQTAQILADHLKLEKGLLATDGLAPTDDRSIWGQARRWNER